MNKDYDKFIKLAINSSIENEVDFLKLKKELSKKLSLPLPANANIRQRYEEMISEGKIKRTPVFEKFLFSKRIRTLSGIAAVAVLTKPYPCPGKCLYCPDEDSMPKSYLSNEPAVMRAIASEFDPYKQTQSRLNALKLNGHAIDKVELIVMGGTFSYLPKKYQLEFITECFRACNDFPQKSNKTSSLKISFRENNLLKEQKRNETALCRIVGLTLETRPDYIDEKEIRHFRRLGCTRVELGVQSIFDDILKKNKRGHLVAKTIQATKLLKEAGFKINYHLMPGLYGSTLQKDFRMFKELFSSPDFQPDIVKIYPCVVTEKSELYDLWKKKKYQPLSNGKTENLLTKIKEVIPPYVRITRLIRDIPEESILAGPNISNLRQILKEKKVPCQCIRCREIGSQYTPQEKIVLDRINYEASQGKEIFLQYVSPDKKKLFALLRLRINNPLQKKKKWQESSSSRTFFDFKNTALIRELHTYGKLTEVDKTRKDSPQHIGLGKKLIQEAETITRKEFGIKRIAVISGVGVRNYYRKLGYRLKDTYMVKNIGEL